MTIFASLYQYNSYLTHRFSSFPNDQDASFKNLQNWIQDDFSNVFQGLFSELCMLKDIASGEWTIGNSPELQNAWARENGFPLLPESSEVNILLEQLRQYKPDVFLAYSYPLGGEFLKTVKVEVPSIRQIVGWDGRRLHDPERFRGIDLILSCSPETVEFYRSNGFQAEYLPFYFDLRVLEKLPDITKIDKIVFPGSIHLARDGHNERLRLLKKLCRLPGFESYLGFEGLRHWRVWAGLFKRMDFDHFFSIARLLARNHRPVFGLDMFRLLASSLVTVNIHIDAAGAFAGNIRLFEAAGVGTCLLTDSKPNLAKLFEPETEIVPYFSPEDCLERARWLLNHPEKATEIGLRGAARVRKSHSTKQRASEMMEIILSSMHHDK